MPTTTNNRRTANTDAALPMEQQIQNIEFGVEIEGAGLSIRQACEVVASVLGSTVEIECGYYSKHFARDAMGRKWTVMYDGSQGCDFEFVTPVCSIARGDVERIQEIIRAFRRAGARAHSNVGMHVHVNAVQGEEGNGLNTLAAIKRFASLIYSREELLVKAFEATHRSHDARNGQSWCRTMSDETIRRLNRRGSDASVNALGAAWYNREGFTVDSVRGVRSSHYHGSNFAREDGSRYHGVNLHSFFNVGQTVELRYFNSPFAHAGKFRAQLLMVLCMAAKARNGRAAAARKIAIAHGNEKYALRSFMLKLGMSGDFFKICRTHLLKPLAGNANRARPAAPASAA